MLRDPVAVTGLGVLEGHRANRALMVADVAVHLSLVFCQVATRCALVFAFGPGLLVDDMVTYVVEDFLVHEVDVLFELARVALRHDASVVRAFALLPLLLCAIAFGLRRGGRRRRCTAIDFFVFALRRGACRV